MSKITTGQMFEQWEQMNQKLEALDEKMNGIIDGTTPANAQLTGSIDEYALPVKVESSVQEDIIIPRNIYNKTVNKLNIDVKEGSKAVLILLDVYGVTGNFSENEGYQLSARFSSYAGSASTIRSGATGWETRTTPQSDAKWIMFGYDVTENLESNKFKVIQALPYPADKLRVDLNIRGTFSEGEGIDAIVRVISIS